MLKYSQFTADSHCLISIFKIEKTNYGATININNLDI